MNTTRQIRWPRALTGPKQPTDPRRRARAPGSARPTFGEMLAEIVPVILLVPGAGPPVFFVLGPWVFLVLMLAAPFAVLVTLAVVILGAAAALVALTAAILSPPYLLARRVRGYRARRAFGNDRPAQLVRVGSTRVVA